jgi:short-subunit dehydrogenase
VSLDFELTSFQSIYYLNPILILITIEMSLQSIVITGANRGIGLEFVRQLLASNPPPKHLVATTRQTTNEELDKLKANNASLHVLKLNTKNYEEFNDLVSKVGQIVGGDGVDTLINNAGILIQKDLEGVTPKDMVENFEVNTVSPLMLTKAFLPLLKVCSNGSDIMFL